MSDSPGTIELGALGRVEPVAELHKGILGPLWLGRGSPDPVLVRRITVRGDVSRGAAEALARAAERAAMLEHDRIVAVLGQGTSATELAIASAYHEGETLRTVLRLAGTGQPMPAAVALRIAWDLLDACAYLHERDEPLLAALTPDNVLVGSDGATRVLEPVVSATAACERPWKENTKRAGYSAPEQLAGGGDARADLFALGALLWEMLRNRALFSGVGYAQIVDRVRSGPIVRVDAPGARVRPAPKGVADVIERALARDPDDRFASAADMLAAMVTEEVAGNAEVASYAGTVLAETLRAQRRNFELARGGATTPVQATPVSIAPRVSPGPARGPMSTRPFEPKAPVGAPAKAPAAPAGPPPKKKPPVPAARQPIDSFDVDLDTDAPAGVPGDIASNPFLTHTAPSPSSSPFLPRDEVPHSADEFELPQTEDAEPFDAQPFDPSLLDDSPPDEAADALDAAPPSPPRRGAPADESPSPAPTSSPPPPLPSPAGGGGSSAIDAPPPPSPARARSSAVEPPPPSPARARSSAVDAPPSPRPSPAGGASSAIEALPPPKAAASSAVDAPPPPSPSPARSSAKADAAPPRSPRPSPASSSTDDVDAPPPPLPSPAGGGGSSAVEALPSPKAAVSSAVEAPPSPKAAASSAVEAPPPPKAAASSAVEAPPPPKAAASSAVEAPPPPKAAASAASEVPSLAGGTATTSEAPPSPAASTPAAPSREPDGEEAVVSARGPAFSRAVSTPRGIALPRAVPAVAEPPIDRPRSGRWIGALLATAIVSGVGGFVAGRMTAPSPPEESAAPSPPPRRATAEPTSAPSAAATPAPIASEAAAASAAPSQNQVASAPPGDSAAPSPSDSAAAGTSPYRFPTKKPPWTQHPPAQHPPGDI